MTISKFTRKTTCKVLPQTKGIVIVENQAIINYSIPASIPESIPNTVNRQVFWLVLSDAFPFFNSGWSVSTFLIELTAAGTAPDFHSDSLLSILVNRTHQLTAQK